MLCCPAVAIVPYSATAANQWRWCRSCANAVLMLHHTCKATSAAQPNAPTAHGKTAVDNCRWPLIPCAHPTLLARGLKQCWHLLRTRLHNKRTTTRAHFTSNPVCKTVCSGLWLRALPAVQHNLKSSPTACIADASTIHNVSTTQQTTTQCLDCNRQQHPHRHSRAKGASVATPCHSCVDPKPCPILCTCE
jgi:hypothetical protein